LVESRTAWTAAWGKFFIRLTRRGSEQALAHGPLAAQPHNDDPSVESAYGLDADELQADFVASGGEGGLCGGLDDSLLGLEPRLGSAVLLAVPLEMNSDLARSATSGLAVE
jgi:hypothetical protein